MDTPAFGSIAAMVGVGNRTDPDSHKTEPVYNFYPTYFNHVVRTFEIYPVFSVFGLTVDDAMNLSVDKWYRIKKAAETLPPIKHVKYDTEAELVKLIKELFVGKE